MTRLKRKAGKRRRRTAGAAEPGVPPESRALPPPAARDSVEDPLDDWTEDDAEADRWVLEREGGDVERGEG
ncbi:MAG: hypothetical protein EPN19_10570 [Betaproteobacteria bacterium]|nr:MAG: hypothetical protein EPN19_10570 [Betaproteobacteria bacterium]